MKKSELRKLIKEEIRLLKEASTLSKIGATKQQVKKAHNLDKLYAVRADAKWEDARNKRELMQIIKSEIGKSWGASEVVAGFDRDKNLFIVKSGAKGWDSTNFYTSQISPKGEVIGKWTDNKWSKALTHLQGIKKYYIARKGNVRKNINNLPTSDERNENLINKVRDITMKYLEKNRAKFIAEIKMKVIKEVNNDNWGAVAILINKFGYEKRYSNDWESRTLRDILSHNPWGKALRYEIGDKIKDKIKEEFPSYGDKELTPQDIRKIGYGVAIDLNKKLKDYYEDV